MKVHLIKDCELSESLFEEITQILLENKGLIKFVKNNTFPASLTNEILSFKECFEACRIFRKEQKIPGKDYVILLTDKPNNQYWFSSPDFENNVFVHCGGWKEYCEVESRYPIVHEIVSNILHSMMFEDNATLLRYTHKNPVGCLNDFCEQKTDVSGKLKTGEICSDCLKIAMNKGVQLGLIQQVMKITSQISISFKQYSIELRKLKPSTLVVDGYKDLFLSDFNSSVHLGAIEKAFYILFLKHPRGINLHQLSTFEKELTEIYFSCNNYNRSRDKIITTISNLCDIENESRYERLTNIRKIFKSKIGEELAKHYTIEEAENNLFKIDLPVHLIHIKK